MKILVLKLISLGVVLLGALLVGWSLEVPEVNEGIVQAKKLVEQYTGHYPSRRDIAVGGGVIMVIAGLYGFLPRLSGGRRRIAYHDEAGDVVIELKSAEATMNKLLAKIPEVYRIHVTVRPDKKGERAVIHADVTLEDQPGVQARETTRVVRDHIEETAKSVLGLEDIVIELKIQGFHLDPKNSTKALRDEVVARAEARRAGQQPRVEVQHAPQRIAHAPQAAPAAAGAVHTVRAVSSPAAVEEDDHPLEAGEGVAPLAPEPVEFPTPSPLSTVSDVTAASLVTPSQHDAEPVSPFDEAAEAEIEEEAPAVEAEEEQAWEPAVPPAPDSRWAPESAAIPDAVITEEEPPAEELIESLPEDGVFRGDPFAADETAAPDPPSDAPEAPKKKKGWFF